MGSAGLKWSGGQSRHGRDGLARMVSGRSEREAREGSMAVLLPARHCRREGERIGREQRHPGTGTFKLPSVGDLSSPSVRLSEYRSPHWASRPTP